MPHMSERIRMLNNDVELGMLNKVGHASFCARCLYGLPATMAEADPSRIAIGFYCLGALDILDLLDTKLSPDDREAWRAWIWAQQVRRPALKRSNIEAKVEGRNVGTPQTEPERDEENAHIGGFRPGPFMHVGSDDSESMLMAAAEADPPHLIMTYTTLLALAILRDDFTRLNRPGLINLLRATQKSDGSFSAFPGQGEADIRMVYTAFAISAMLGDWSGVDIPRAIGFAKRCMSYEGGFGQAPGNEAQGGPTYCVLATLALVPPEYRSEATLSSQERKKAERWLVLQQQPRRVYEVVQEYEEEEEEEDSSASDGELQDEITDSDQGVKGRNVEGKKRQVETRTELVEEGGGFAGRTEKAGDACYSFWCGAALRILRSGAVGVGSSSSSTSSSGTLPTSALASQEARTNGRPDSELVLIQRQPSPPAEKGCAFEDPEARDEEEQLEREFDSDWVDRLTHARFLSRCQFRLGGLAKAPDALPDPYHTYLSLAALALYPPYPLSSSTSSSIPVSYSVQRRERDSIDEGKKTKKKPSEKERESWRVARLDPLINSTVETSRWAKEKIPMQTLRKSQSQRHT